jgi:hypothetical protein
MGTVWRVDQQRQISLRQWGPVIIKLRQWEFNRSSVLTDFNQKYKKIKVAYS